MNRTRSSLYASIPSLFHRRNTTRPHTEPAFESIPAPSYPFYRRPSTPRHAATDQGFLPHVQVPELDLSFEQIPNHLELPRLSSPRRELSRTASMSDRLSSLRPDRGIRSMTSSLRRRRSPLQSREEDQAANLSRLLSVAAAAAAASLMSDDHRAVSEARSVAGDGEDGTFDSFLQALQSGRIASALRQSSNQNEDGVDTPGAGPAPLNVFRMFRFGSSTTNRRNDGTVRLRSSRSSGMGSPDSQASDDDEPDGRMVPIIIVGIRSINPGSSPLDDNIPPFLDALSTFPTPLASPSGENTIDGILRQPQNSTRFSHRRRASLGGMNTFPAGYDSQRHHRSPERPRPWSTFTDSPSGPLPPPTTPASAGLSAVSSGANTPARSAASATPSVQSTIPSRRESLARRPTGASLEATAEEPQSQQRTPRQRRLSESDFTRFGSGASRRNGVVEPDHTPGEGARSWIIYVLGGSYPENHPILTTPSLFTDSPTYEDMMLLSTLLGPAKPPVASEDDVASAPGLYWIRGSAGTLVAQSTDGSDSIDISPEARCLVCLCDFEVGQEARNLIKCGHLFHRECIDQWLTTGRNSCPLCRGQGVDEKSADQPDVADADALPTMRPSTVS
ncbi:uncharacterized protein BDZ99DRAFT_490639 [Mytilinidion resinicola]|uniref:RING-type domain-containing protein n=1 Tax=Mytilinidion resinicola TaxID=574789 RepID=A0A6A6YB08_9PEZI|nr:uncharacterized protein BDZ99DRAFT_490639 [Mytilinidion resinicola]KAF2805683.1 hypothetical protein BDZ99DRAFT_490639 [Mytilinidion resinicola]